MDVSKSSEEANIPRVDEENTPLIATRQFNDEELKVGMIVSNEEEAYNLYNGYAIQKGFSIRKAQIRRVKGDIIRQRNYVCWKAGFREDEDYLELKKVNRLETRTGCKASVRFTIKNGVWEITNFNPDHDHELAKPEQRHLIKSNRRMLEAHKGVISSMVDAGIKATKTYSYLAKEVGGVQNVGFTERDCHNYLRTQRLNLIEAGDGQSVINHFRHQQAEDPLFFYSVQVDQENRMTNFFWRDGRSKIDYDCFGDVLVFDTTFRTNKYNMICAPFVGVNHHWKNVLFGCAFLLDETISSFTWLFETFLESMGNRQPRTIFTDQDQAIANAIGKIFVESRHRLCLWHISKNATQYISHLYANPEFKRIFTKCFHGCQTETEFESTWNVLIERFKISEIKWLTKLYELRAKWCPVFSLDTFSAKMRSSQRSESTNRVFTEMSTKTMTLIEFIHQYEGRTQGMRSTESNEDYRCSQGVPPKVVKSGILNHASNVYTVKIFVLFEKEFISSLGVKLDEISNDGVTYTYQLIEEDHIREHIVQFHSSNTTVKCSCKMFESMGILCRHALRVINVRNISTIPSQYILKRWTKDAKKGMGDYDNGKPSHRREKSSMTLRLSDLMHASYRVMSKSSMTTRTTKLAKEKLAELLELVEKDLVSSIIDGNVENEDIESGYDNATGHRDSLGYSDTCNETPVLNPQTIRPKGVSKARMKSGLEKSKKKISKSTRVACPAPQHKKSKSMTAMQTITHYTSQGASEALSQAPESQLKTKFGMGPNNHCTNFPFSTQGSTQNWSFGHPNLSFTNLLHSASLMPQDTTESFITHCNGQLPPLSQGSTSFDFNQFNSR